MNEPTVVAATTKKSSIFKNVEDLISSEDPSTSNTKLECPFCSKCYITFFGLRRHVQSHMEGKIDQTCPHCYKHYKSAGALKMHLNTHSLPCICDICGKSFSRPWLLKGHARTHTGEKPFECVECGRSFADRSNLRAHKQTHYSVKKYGCTHCQLSFARVQVKKKHELTCPSKQ